MRINQKALALAACGVALLNAGCTGPDGGSDVAAAPAGAPPKVEGMVAYEQACGSCHDSGKDGAPVTGNAADWQGRSALWESVLFEHAKAGYFRMPARGNVPELSDELVEAAAEYMLAITHPERPPDED